VSFAHQLQRLFMGAGVAWVLYALAGLSVLVMAVVFERLVFYQRRRLAPEAVQALAQGREVAVATDSIERRVAARLSELQQAEMARPAVESAIETELRKQRGRYEAGLTFLATLGNNAPFVGLLGTVLGIMAAFWQLAAITDATRKNELLMSSISEALIATAMGLLVAIPAVAFYNVFRKRVSAAVERAREIVAQRMYLMFENGHGLDADR